MTQVPHGAAPCAAAPRWASTTSTVFAPAHTVAVTCVAMGLGSAPWPDGVRWAVLTLALCAGVPVAIVYALARHRVLESRFVRPKRQRFVTLAGVAVLEAAALGTLWWLGAPPLLMGMLTACVVGVVALTAVTPLVRASIHTGAPSVIAGVLAPVALPVALGVLALACVVGAARLVEREHTRVEVLTGLLWGFAVGAIASLVLVQ